MAKRVSDVISCLREARKRPHRYLMDYLNLRSRLGGGILICIFEGREDLPVYDTWIRRIYTQKYEPLPVNGKENVLDLNVILQKINETQEDNVLFFVDGDFDDKKGRNVDGRLYLTPCYSIENLLISQETFECVLIHDLGLINQEQPFRQPLVETFLARLDEFNQVTLPINAYIRWMGIENVECVNLNGSIARLVSVNTDCISAKFGDNCAEITEIFEAKAAPLPAILQEHISWLKQHNLTLIGRGKFILDFVKIFLSALYKDRRSNNPKYFAHTDKTRPDPTQDLLRKLASYTNCPPCLEHFLRKHLSPLS